MIGSKKGLNSSFEFQTFYSVWFATLICRGFCSNLGAAFILATLPCALPPSANIVQQWVSVSDKLQVGFKQLIGGNLTPSHLLKNNYLQQEV